VNETSDDRHYAEYLALEAAVLALVREVEQLVAPRIALDPLDPLAQRTLAGLAAAHRTVGKANTAALGLLTTSDTDWCLESTQRELIALRLALAS
jgi:hypothetical protein